jgi:hypothetical protein
MVLLALLGVKVWAKLEATDLGYSLARERQKTVALDMERRELELQRSVLMRPDSLSRSARTLYGSSDGRSRVTVTGMTKGHDGRGNHDG